MFARPGTGQSANGACAATLSTYRGGDSSHSGSVIDLTLSHERRPRGIGEAPVPFHRVCCHSVRSGTTFQTMQSLEAGADASPCRTNAPARRQVARSGNASSSRPSDRRGLWSDPEAAMCVQEVDVSMWSCNSHYFSQLAALFIDTRAE